MAAKSPTTSIRSREVIGSDTFSQRREVFDKHDTVFLPSPILSPRYVDVEPIITSNHGKTTSNFKRNTPGYSSMRESREDYEPIEYRTRKYSDNFTSDLNKSDDSDYRNSLSDRTRRLSRLRREFLKSNLHDHNDKPFVRGTGTRTTINGPIHYKIESPNLHKFPFAEPFATPPPTRKTIPAVGPEGNAVNKENQSPSADGKHKSLSPDTIAKIADHQKLFNELVKRYSPQRKPIDKTLPPTRPRIVDAMPKTSEIKKGDDQTHPPTNNEENTVNHLEQKIINDIDKTDSNDKRVNEEKETVPEQNNNLDDTKLSERKESDDSKLSLTELEEKNDKVPELSNLHRQLSLETGKKVHNDIPTDLTLPDLIEKINKEGNELENHSHDKKKVKRKRSFLDKLLGRKKGNKVE